MDPTSLGSTNGSTSLGILEKGEGAVLVFDLTITNTKAKLISFGKDHFFSYLF